MVKKSNAPRKKSAYWSDINNVDKELRQWLTDHKYTKELPTYSELKKSGCTTLSRIITTYGGMRVFAERLNIPVPEKLQNRKPMGYWKDIENVEAEIIEWMNANKQDTFPTRRQLRDGGHASLVEAIVFHGGIGRVAARMDKEVKRRLPKYWTSDENFKQEISPYLTEVIHSLRLSY